MKNPNDKKFFHIMYSVKMVGQVKIQPLLKIDFNKA